MIFAVNIWVYYYILYDVWYLDVQNKINQQYQNNILLLYWNERFHTEPAFSTVGFYVGFWNEKKLVFQYLYSKVCKFCTALEVHDVILCTFENLLTCIR